MRSRLAGAKNCTHWMMDLIGEPVKEYPQFEAALCLFPVLPPDEALACCVSVLSELKVKLRNCYRVSQNSQRRNSQRCFS